MANTACHVCFISTVNGCSKKRKKVENALEDAALVAHNKTETIYYSLDIYDRHPLPLVNQPQTSSIKVDFQHGSDIFRYKKA